MNIYNNIYGINTTGLEIDLRQEIYNTLHGSIDEIKKGRIGLIRIMNRDSNGDPIRCPCRDKQTDDGNRDSYCRFCLGANYIWTEYPVLYYKNEDSYKENEGFLFYLEYNNTISDIDYIVTVKLNSSGEPIIPAVRDKVYKINFASEERSDNGRIEFWQIRAKEERKWSVYYDVKNRQF